MNNIKTVLKRYRDIKIKRAYAAIGAHFKYDFDKWLEIFDYEYRRQLKKWHNNAL